MATPSHIRISNLHKSYQDGEGNPLHILRGIHLELPQGATVSIMGASGTGKSTFLHMLGALDQADEGSIEIEGKEIEKMTREETAQFRNQKIGFVFQFHYLLQDFTALENVMMPLRINHKTPLEAQNIATQLLIEVGLQQRLTHRPAQLSGGEQQRVAVARAIANSPRILLADEPTGNLDESTGQHMTELLHRLNQERQITLVIVTHNPKLAASMHYRYRMENGLLH